MKHVNKLLLTSMLALLGLGLVSCSEGESSSSSEGSENASSSLSSQENNSSTSGSGETTSGSATETPEGEGTDEDFWHKEENDFNSDPDTEHTTVVKDETPLDKGELKPYRFEFESSKFYGKTKKDTHLCLLQSYAFSPEASGNFVMKNINGGSAHTFTFTSDKAVRVPAIVHIARKKGATVIGEYNVTINGKDWVYGAESIDKDGKTPVGLNKTYFEMVTSKIEISLKKGENELVFAHRSNDCANVDYVELQTSAKIVNKTITNQPDLSKAITISQMPTESAPGKMKIGCKVEPTHATAFAEYNIPALSNKTFYTKKQTETSLAYQAAWGNNTFDVISANTLTLQGGAKFSDGSTSKLFFAGEKVDITYTAPDGEGLVKWVNSANESEEYDVNFIMPNKSVTIKPVTVPVNNHTLTLVNAKFEDGTTSKSVSALSSPKIVTTPDEGKSVVGWKNVDTNQFIEGEKFIMPDADIKIAPIYGAAPFIGNAFGKVDIGNSKVVVENIATKQEQNGDLKSNKNQFVGDEFGLIVNRSGITTGERLLIETNSTIEGKFKFTTTFVNMGATPIKFVYNQFTKYSMSDSHDTNSGLNLISDVVVLQPGEEIEISLSNTKTSWNRNIHSMFRLWFEENVTGLKIGVYQYAKKI